MKKNLTPYFVVNGTKYEILVTRYLQAEYDKLIKENSKILKRQEFKAIQVSDKLSEIDEIAQKYKKAKQDFFNDPINENLEKIYKKYKALYNESMDEINKEQSLEEVDNFVKMSLDILEKIVIIGLKENYKDKTEEELTHIWESYVDKIGQQKAIEWLNAMSECIIGHQDENTEKENGEDDFLSQMELQRKKK